MDDYDEHYILQDHDGVEIEVEETEGEGFIQFHDHYYSTEGDEQLLKDFDSKLINKVKEYPCLYNNKQKLSDAELDEAWANVAACLEQSVEACQYRWKRLRQYYAKERTKRLKPDHRQKKWALFEEMNFLSPFVLKRKLFKKPITKIIVGCEGETNENSVNNLIVYQSDELDYDDFFDLKLIEIIKDHPCIYNPEEKKTRNCENEAWAKISTQLDKPVEDCISRYRRLRQYYAKERAKIEVYGDNYKKWAFFDLLSFLEPFIKRRMTARMLSQNLEDSYLTNNDNMKPEDFENFEFNDAFDKKLILAIKEHPCIYDPEERVDRNCETEAWKKISKALLHPINICQSRYIRLRQYYAKERQKRESSTGSLKQWPLYDEMHFLKPFIKRRRIMKSFDETRSTSQKSEKEKTENNEKLTDPSFYFDEEFDFNLVEFAKKFPCIYNHRKRTSQSAVRDAWNAISLKLKTPANVCERRFIRLRQYYAKERQKQEKNKPHREWPLYKTMNFFEPFIKKRNYTNVKRKKNTETNQIKDNQESNNGEELSENDYNIYYMDVEVDYGAFLNGNDSCTSEEINSSKNVTVKVLTEDSLLNSSLEENEKSNPNEPKSNNFKSNNLKCLEHKNFEIEIKNDDDDDLIQSVTNGKRNVIINLDENSSNEKINEEIMQIVNANNSKDDDPESLTFKPCDTEKLKSMISSSAANVATNFYWPDFTMTVIKKKR